MQKSFVVLALLAVLLSACGGDPYQPTTRTPAKPTEYTGILLNCQRPPTLTPFKSTLDTWKVVDPAGNTLFSSEDVPKSSMRATEWAWKRSQIEGSRIPHRALGANPFEIKMTKDEYSDDYKSGTFYVSDATAADIRNKMAKVMQLLKRWQIVILVGKMGE
jgi:hypothetical protein